jgi:hypothetical protein
VEKRTVSRGKNRPWARSGQSCQAHTAERRQGELKQLWRLGHPCVSSASKRQSHRKSRQKLSSVCGRWVTTTEKGSTARVRESEKKEAMGPGRACSIATLLSRRLPLDLDLDLHAMLALRVVTRGVLNSMFSARKYQGVGVRLDAARLAHPRPDHWPPSLDSLCLSLPLAPQVRTRICSIKAGGADTSAVDTPSLARRRAR